MSAMVQVEEMQRPDGAGGDPVSVDLAVLDRSPVFCDGARWAIRRTIAWLHERAAQMEDPMARAVLNAAATNMGWWKREVVGEDVEAGGDAS